MKKIVISLCTLLAWNHGMIASDFVIWKNDTQQSEINSSFVSYHASSTSIAPFYKLSITEKEARTISKLIKGMAENSIYKLLWRKSEFERMGDSIHHLHPVRFLGHIFHSKNLTNCMRTIRRSYFKWNSFMVGLKLRIVEEHRGKNIRPYIYGFADYIDRNPEDIMYYVDSADWDGLIKYLLNS
ncbi:MAG: hypothetical protein WDZ28_02275 [Simkaniaceae bacterium]